MAEIKLYGTLVNMTSDQKVAYTRQLYDEIINKFQDAINEDIYNKLKTSDTSIEDINTVLSNLIIDSLDSDDNTKALSAKQGKVLKSLVEAIHSFSIIVMNEGEELPTVGKSNTLYFKKKTGTLNDVYDEYIYVNSDWELIGTTQIDLSDYYTKSEVNTIKTQIENKIPTIPNIEISITGQGNVATSIDVDNDNKHKLIVNKELDVYSKQQVDDKLSDSGLGDVSAVEAFTTADRVITSNGAGKVVKDSGILISNLALKSDLTWDSVQDKPSTFPPSAHNHVLADITDAGALAGKDKVDESDLNFNIPEVDSTLSTTSENPVQNKVITTELNNKIDDSDLNTALTDYYTKSEVDEKIGSAGGGDVMASDNLVENNIVLGAGTKSIKDSGKSFTDLALKSEIPSLEGYATETSVSDNYYPLTGGVIKGSIIPEANKSQTVGSSSNRWDVSYVNTMHCSVIQFRDTAGQIGTTQTPCRIIFLKGTAEPANGIYIDNTAINTNVLKVLKSNGSATEFLAGDGSYHSATFTLPAATSTVLGGIKTGYTESGGSELAVYLTPDNKAYTNVTSVAVTTALGFIPANANDIPEIPIALPNPYSLSITAGGSTNVYTGSAAVSIDLDNIFNLPTASTAGAPGIFVGTAASYTVNTVQVTAAKPDAVIVVPTATTVTFGSSYQKVDGLDSLSGGTYKCYCISRINSDIVLVNGAIYG